MAGRRTPERERERESFYRKLEFTSGRKRRDVYLNVRRDPVRGSRVSDDRGMCELFLFRACAKFRVRERASELRFCPGLLRAACWSRETLRIISIFAPGTCLRFAGTLHCSLLIFHQPRNRTFHVRAHPSDTNVIFLCRVLSVWSSHNDSYTRDFRRLSYVGTRESAPFDTRIPCRCARKPPPRASESPQIYSVHRASNSGRSRKAVR